MLSNARRRQRASMRLRFGSKPCFDLFGNFLVRCPCGFNDRLASNLKLDVPILRIATFKDGHIRCANYASRAASAKTFSFWKIAFAASIFGLPSLISALANAFHAVCRCATCAAETRKAKIPVVSQNLPNSRDAGTPNAKENATDG